MTRTDAAGGAGDVDAAVEALDALVREGIIRREDLPALRRTVRTLRADPARVENLAFRWVDSLDAALERVEVKLCIRPSSE